MAQSKLSDIAISGGNPALTDYLVGVSAANVDLRYTLAQIAAGIISGGTDKQVLFNDGGTPKGDAGLTYDKATANLTLGGNVLAANGTVIGTGGAYVQGLQLLASNSAFATHYFNAQGSGTPVVTLKRGANFGYTSGDPNGSAQDGIFQSPAAANWQLGATDAAAPVAQTLSVQNVVAGTSNTSGANWTHIASLSTGSGTNGDFIFQTGGTGAGAAVQNTATTALTIKGGTQAAIFAANVQAPSYNISASDVVLSRFGAGLPGLSNGVSATKLQVYSTTDSTTSPTNYSRVILDAGTTAATFKMGSEHGGSGTALTKFILQVDGATKLDYASTTAGVWTMTGTLNMAAGSSIRLGAVGDPLVWINSTQMTPPANGNLMIQNFTGTTFGLLMLGGSTSSFPAIKRSSATIAIRLADDSADAALTASSLSGTAAVTAFSGTAIPAGGTAGSGLLVSSTANYGVFFGSGAPTLSAAKGSLYLRSDGSTTNDRAYINTNGTTTWTALTTAA